ncbi:hypothetical protein ABXK61_16095 [Burkholderia sola]|nr:hypothetical protein [Burkholderia sp. AcTa6-5]
MGKAKQAVFETSRAACRWALRYAYEQYAMSPAAKLAGGAAMGSGKGLIGLDGAGQAGMVLAEIEALSRFEMAFVVAMCAQRSFECKCGDECCQGWRPNKMWKNAIEFISEFALEQTDKSFANLTLRRMMIEKHFGVKHTSKEIAEAAGVSARTVNTRWREISDVLRAAEYPIWVRFDAKLEEIGMTGCDFS